MNTRKIGIKAEELVTNYLLGKQYTILERNFRIPSAEIDIIAIKNSVINFIEVKKIPENWDGVDIAAKVNVQKRSKIRFAASSYLALHREIKYDKVSFDIALVTGNDINIFFGAF